jgi:enediyne biosynthesis protein E4
VKCFENLPGLFLILLLIWSCSTKDDRQPGWLFNKVSSSQTGIDFSNDLQEDDDFNIVEYLYYYNGGGVATGDINNDGLTDVYFTSNQGSNKLYLNKGEFRFEDITETAGAQGQGNWKSGVTMADVNGDSFLDIFICGVGNYKKFDGRNQLLINNGDLTFTDQTEKYGLTFSGFSTQGAFFDADNDGDLDLYLLNHSVHTPRSYGNVLLRNQSDRLSGDKLYENQLIPHGSERFKEITSAAGIFSSQIGYGLGIAIADLNEDGYSDIYVCNDFHENDYLYINKKDGAFSQELEKTIPHSTRFSMGVDIADIDNNGWKDVLTMDMQPSDEEIIKTTAGEDPYDIFEFKLRFGYHYQFTRNALQLNHGPDKEGHLIFSDVAALAGIEATDWSWASLFADFDNDGLKDLFISNGIARRPNDLDYINFISTDSAQRILTNKQFTEKMPEGKVPDYFFKNNGGVRFDLMNDKWVDSDADLSNGASYADLDNDGDLDLIVSHINATASVYRNDQNTSNRFITVELKGEAKNTNGIGAKIKVFSGGKILNYEQMLTRGWLSSVDPKIVIGLGQARVDSLIVIWPSGRYENVKGIGLNQKIVLKEMNARMKWNFTAPAAPSMLTLVSDDLFTHVENNFIPFSIERLLPGVVSNQGPKMCIGDLNGDKLNDFFIGGAKGRAGEVFVQDKGFRKMASTAIDADSSAEDTGSCLFDTDGDGDLDLLVVSGGQEMNSPAEDLYPRLYINDGKGRFSKSQHMFPEIAPQASCVESADFDGDGDADLFIGGRVVAGRYGVIPESFLVANDGKGNFKDVSELLPDQSPGLITDAKWVDLNADGKVDIILVGEWMDITVLVQNQEGRFDDRTSAFGLSETSGLWNCVEASDFDNDGDTDFVVGNLGKNSRLRASVSEPIELYAGDFDDNGGYEQILTYFNNGKRYPFISRDQLVKQIPSLKKQFLKYADFRTVSLEQIIPPGKKGVTKLNAELLSSVYLKNDGDRFTVVTLPDAGQITPVFAMLPFDVNNDGFEDILGAGNYYQVQPELGRYDAGYGFVLLGDGTGKFSPMDFQTSGFVVKGEVRDINAITDKKGQTQILVGRNNDSLLIFK